MTLKEGQVTQHYIVKEVNLEQATRRRLEALGLIRGTKIQLLNKSTDGAVVFKVRNTRLAIGEHIAGSIIIVET